MRIDPSIDPRLDQRFQALCREAAIAAEQMAAGATLLGRAHSVQSALYNQAFFSLSIGMERAGKLAFVLDHCFENGGSFPNDDELRRQFGHNVRKLIEKADEISQRRSPGNEYERFPRSDITEGIINTLTEFAQKTRHYNLYLLGKSKPQEKSDPMKRWYERVGKPILDKHYKPKQKAKHCAEAAVVGELMDKIAFVMHTTERMNPRRWSRNSAARSASPRRPCRRWGTSPYARTRRTTCLPSGKKTRRQNECAGERIRDAATVVPLALKPAPPESVRPSVTL